MSTRSGRVRASVTESSPPRTRKGLSPPRSPARSRKSSPPAQSAPRRSPARKSPARKTASKFPARKSPSRSFKEAVENTAPRSPVKLPSKKAEIKLHDVQSKVELLRNTRTQRSEYSIKDFSTGLDFLHSDFSFGDKINGVESIISTKNVFALRSRKTAEAAPRRSSRLRDPAFETRNISPSKSLSKSKSKSISKSVETFSDDDASNDVTEQKSMSVTRKLSTPLREGITKSLAQVNSKWEFGGRLGSAFLIAAIPMFVFSILLLSEKQHTMLNVFSLNCYKHTVWLSPRAVIMIVSQLVVQAVLAVAPIAGTRAHRMDDTKEKYCFNALFSSIFTVTLVFVLDFCEILGLDTLFDEFIPLAVVSYIVALLLSIVLYLKSSKYNQNVLNPYASTGYMLYDFFMGREIHPSFKNLNVKIWVSRVSNINTLVLLLAVFKNGIQIDSRGVASYIQTNMTHMWSIESYREIASKVQFEPTLLVYCMMQIIYILYYIVGEYKITSTFFWQSEGVGYLLLVTSTLYPFYFVTISKCVAESGLVLSAGALIAVLCVFSAGLSIMFISNKTKYEFRKDPLQPCFANMESMPTFHGKKLLVSGAWGRVRHPNYAGDALVHAALCAGSAGGARGAWAAGAVCVATLAALCARARRVATRCARRYGAAWPRYRRRVPAALLPGLL